jgi:hypothetical protein
MNCSGKIGPSSCPLRTRREPRTAPRRGLSLTSPKRITAGTALVGKMARRAMTRANPHHLARLFLPLDRAHLGRADAPSCDQSTFTFLLVVKGTGTLVGGSRSGRIDNALAARTVPAVMEARLTFSDAAALGREAQRRHHRGHTQKARQSSSSVNRTNDLVKGIFR